MLGRLRRAARELLTSDFDAEKREMERRFTAGYMTDRQFAALQKRGDQAAKMLQRTFKKEGRTDAATRP